MIYTRDLKNFNRTTMGPKIDLDPEFTGTPREGTGDPRLALPELKIPVIKFPNPKFPETLKGWRKPFFKVDFFINQRKVGAMYRKRVTVGGRPLWVYYLQDGTIYWTFNEVQVDGALKCIAVGTLGLVLIYLTSEV